MKKQYTAPTTEIHAVEYASFLASSGEIGDAVAVDVFDGAYGKTF